MKSDFLSSKDLTPSKINLAEGFDVTLLLHTNHGISTIQLGFANTIATSVKYSRKTVTTYISCLNTYVKFLYAFEDIENLSIDRAILMARSFQVDDFLFMLRKHGYSANYIVTIDAALR